MSKQKKISNNVREFLLTFFDKLEGYDEKLINNHWLVKSFNGNSDIWQVSVYTLESFKAYKQFKDSKESNEEKAELERQTSFLHNL